MRFYAPWEKTFKKISTPFEHFLHSETTTGIFLLISTILALLLANSYLSEEYFHFFHTNISLQVGSWVITNTIHHWINDGLMTLFFFIIGLEIKREILVGELSDIKVAILPILAAIGGMIFPALIYLWFNSSFESDVGWGIPMATDIAFAVSILVLLKSRIPSSLITFLVALAIVDDLGAVIVIATLYTDSIQLFPLVLSGVLLAVLVTFNRMGIHSITPYFLVGIIIWFFILESGIHATIAGVLVALTIPSKPKLNPESFSNEMGSVLAEFDNHPIKHDHLLDEEQKGHLANMKCRIDAISSPSSKMERNLHLPIALIVIPLFALANAGIILDFEIVKESLYSPVALGIIFGLVFGKVIGIFGVAFVAIKLGIAKMPLNCNFFQLFGVSFLGGIGFTMSIFVAELAFHGDYNLISQAKVGILFASLFAGITGYILLRLSSRL
jgi:NhaA family Na+:H+ antiporter